MKGNLSFGKLMIAFLLIGLGVGFLLDNLGILEFDFGEIVRGYWPVILILIGINIIIDGFRQRARFSGAAIPNLIIGLILLLIGWNFFAENFSLFAFDFSLLWDISWPLIIILIGISLLTRKRGSARMTNHAKKNFEYEGTYKNHSHNENEDKKNTYYKSSLIGDYRLGKEVFELTDDITLWNGIGDIDIDLTKAIISNREHQIHISGWIGDVDIEVPKEIPVSMETNVKIGELRVFGVKEDGIGKLYSYKSVGYDEATKRLFITIDLKIGDVRIVERD